MLTKRAMAIQSVLESHVMKRREETLRKFEGKEDALSKNERAKAIKEYDVKYILLEGAKYSDQVQIATHVAKGVHPDLKVKNVTNILVDTVLHKEMKCVGSHSIIEREFIADSTGNGAVNKKGYELHLLMQVIFEGEKIIDILTRDDPDAMAALGEFMGKEQFNPSQLKDLYRDKCEELSSHNLAKQLYWFVEGDPVDDDSYHLLAPLYPSSLIHRIYGEIHRDRFGEENSLARKARSEDKPSTYIFKRYPKLAVQKLGGTKPQNISQLNSERRGANYLLSSSPPIWRSNNDRMYLGIDSTLNYFRSFEGVNTLVKQLIALLKSDPSNTMETRKRRENIERALGQSLATFGLSIRQSFEPGWTRSPECNLVLCEQIWLDPERAELPARPDFEEQDLGFQQALAWKDWPDQVAHRFGNWLNDILRKENLPVGDIEHRHWARQAIIDAEWPATFNRNHALQDQGSEVKHG